ncbi:MAG: double-strand break repair protein AddB [Pseudomonadota bacterium]
MFEPSPTPRIFGSAPGVDFAQSLVTGLITRQANADPTAMARVTIFVNTTRMQRRLREVFDAGSARLLPRIRLITDLAHDPVALSLPQAVPKLQRRLELVQFVSKLLEAQPDLAPRASLYALSDSLAALMDEMQGEGVTPETLASLDVSQHSDHWDRALQFLRIITPYFAGDGTPPDVEARQRNVVEMLAQHWASAPPADPVIIAGSTGSRGATALLMQAVANLPQGAIILPGFDFDLPGDVWNAMSDALLVEDHPQYRFKRLMDQIGFGPKDVRPWSATAPAAPARNRLISLSLRPAPVTDQWLADGPKLQDLTGATAGLTLVEAPSARAEAETIALRLRQAAEDGVTAALISPDRMLTRQVTAALDRWGITPDDSAGQPLALSPPGRLLRHVADLFGKQLTAEALLTILKHPLCHSGRDDRGQHLLHTRDLELHLRRYGPPFPTADALLGWADKDPKRTAWAAWLAQLITGLDQTADQPLTQAIAQHLTLAEALCAGPDATGTGALWDEAAGREARRVCDNLLQAAPHGGAMSPRDYAALFSAVIADGTVRDRDAGYPGILIWGTLEARVQGVDLAILGGLNEGIWPEAPPPDPWLNRQMRIDAGLLLPERRVGLSAHDYQQAVAQPEVWITRARRSADAETVPSRWINRLTNLLGGLPDQGGPTALQAMRDRGQHWLAMAEALSTPSARTDPATRPSPCPPVASRPDRLSVTQIKTLVRDPYAIYAKKVLRLAPLDPLTPTTEWRLRGIIIHRILERFIRAGHGPEDRDALIALAEAEFHAQCPWPTIRAQWLAGMAKLADHFLTGERDRQTCIQRHAIEKEGAIIVAPSGVLLTCKADRIDLHQDGHALIYDYKTGRVPSTKEQKVFDKQLLLEAAMLARGAFGDLGPLTAQAASFIGLGSALKDVPAPLADEPAEKVWAELETLFGNWQDPHRGYTARMALFSKDDPSDYDHLSRYGEWDTNARADPQVLT